MGDNTQIKDGLGNEYASRAKDISATQDGSLRRVMTFSTAYPLDYAPGGSFHLTSKSGSMAAALAANAPIYSFRWTSASLLAVVRRVRLSAWSLGTGFTAGLGTFDMFVARTFTAPDTGGVTDTITGNNGKLRTGGMAASALAEIRHAATATLTAGTRTLDAQPIESWNAAVGTATYTPLSNAPVKLFEAPQGEHPLVLAQNEGFVIQATVPATGVWGFAITPEWDEVPQF